MELDEARNLTLQALKGIYQNLVAGRTSEAPFLKT